MVFFVTLDLMLARIEIMEITVVIYFLQFFLFR